MTNNTVKMKIYTIAITIITSVALFGCNKCQTCTYTKEDGTVLTSEVCERGLAGSESLRQHEKSGWLCQ